MQWWKQIHYAYAPHVPKSLQTVTADEKLWRLSAIEHKVDVFEYITEFFSFIFI